MARKNQSKTVRRSSTYTGPHSWLVSAWDIRAPDVVPHTYSKAKYFIRTHRKELILAGALTRVGKDLIVLGEPYDRWLKSRRDSVVNYNANLAGLERHREEATS